MGKLKVLMASPEVVPFAKTGGLADVVGALPKELEKLDAEVKIILPKYKQMDINKFKIKEVKASFLFPVGSTMERGKLWYSKIGKNVQILLIENEKFFDRDGLYGTSAGDYPDNLKRFVFFSRGVLETIRLLDWKPDIIHCHDWQTALIPTYLKTLYKEDEFFQGIKTVFTIHNLAYQGVFPPEQFVSTGLDWEEYNPDKLEFYNKINTLKAGLVYSDKLTTVSPQYSKEIQTPEFGCGLEGVLQARSEDLVGILNGIDYSIWSPGRDTLLAVKYTANKLKISNKLKIKQQLLNIHNMPVESAEKVPILGSISRLADQKGYDLIAAALPMLMNMDIRLIILGTGDEKYHTLLSDLAKLYPEKIAVNLLFDEALAHLIYAGTDMFLMPSNYEPCGLGQLIALRYGTIPLVNPTGGLVDTVQDYNPETEEGNGFVMQNYSPEALLDAISRGVNLYQDQEKWKKLMTKGMMLDFSWKASAEKYLELYKSLLPAIEE